VSCDLPKVDTKAIKEEQDAQHIKYLPSKKTMAHFASRYTESIMGRFDEPEENVADSIREAKGIALFYVNSRNVAQQPDFASKYYQEASEEVYKRRLLPSSAFKVDSLHQVYYRFKPEYEMDSLYGVWCLAIQAEEIRKIAPNGLGSPGKR
jgi:hypothetical protein